MLYQITKHCSLNCPHCLVDAKPDNSHASLLVTNKVIRFINKAKCKTLLVSGGEPTEHPDLLKHLVVIANKYKGIKLLATNGQFFKDESYTKELAKLSKKIELYIQISALEMYSNREMTQQACEKYKDLFFNAMIIEEPTAIDKLGRAKDKDWSYLKLYKRKAPNCINIFSSAYPNFIVTFSDLIKAIEKVNFCKPMIAYDGQIYAGESNECLRIGCIEDSQSKILSNIRKSEPCGRCGIEYAHIVKMLKKEYRRFI